MIQIKPFNRLIALCSCGSQFNFKEIVWQGLHICERLECNVCGNKLIKSLPVNQSNLEEYTLQTSSGMVTDLNGKPARINWYSGILQSINRPVIEEVEMEIEVLCKSDEVIILNTLDYIYGHSLYFLFNIQHIARMNPSSAIVVIVQPMLRWLIPVENVAEIWTVKLGFKALNRFYPDLSDKINQQLKRFSKVYLSKGHIIPTNSNIQIEKFTTVKRYNFLAKPATPRITFIWREDPGRLWIRNIWLMKGLKKIGISKTLLPVQYLRVRLLFCLLNLKVNGGFRKTIAGLGKSFKFPDSFDDRRIIGFDIEKEKMLCKIYSESELVIGIHGSSMILPSAHAGMAVSLMPSKRWGNFAEDILYVEEDKRLAAFQRRVLPLNLSVFEISDIVADMLDGREYFIRKFIHSDEL